MATRQEKKEKAAAKKLTWHEFAAMGGGAVLALSLFLPWYSVERRGTIGDGKPGPGDFTGWEVHDIQRWLLLGAAVAPFILAYIVARSHKLSWKPGEVTMIVGMIAFALILLNGLIMGKPGDTVDMKFQIGCLVGLFGSLLLMIGGTLRQALSADAKKPPGVM